MYIPYPKLKTIGVVLLISCVFGSCKTLKSYQLVYQNDSQMQPSSMGIEKLESDGISFREGASGGEGGHTGGGCGCN
jgi:hypothetical protein